MSDLSAVPSAQAARSESPGLQTGEDVKNVSSSIECLMRASGSRWRSRALSSSNRRLFRVASKPAAAPGADGGLRVELFGSRFLRHPPSQRTPLAGACCPRNRRSQRNRSCVQVGIACTPRIDVATFWDQSRCSSVLPLQILPDASGAARLTIQSPVHSLGELRPLSSRRGTSIAAHRSSAPSSLGRGEETRPRRLA